MEFIDNPLAQQDKDDVIARKVEPVLQKPERVFHMATHHVPASFPTPIYHIKIGSRTSITLPESVS